MSRLLQVLPPGAKVNNTKASAELQALRKRLDLSPPDAFYLYFMMCLTIASPICNGPAVMVDIPGAAHGLI